LAAEHILTALAMSPARMHFCMVAKNTSLLIDAPNRYTERSAITAIEQMSQNRMSHIAHPPAWK
jgi:hypothetical protein